MKLRLRQLADTAKEFVVSSFNLLSKGISFETLVGQHLEKMRRFLPSNLQFPAECFAIYVFFHLYLAYILAFALTSFLLKQTKIKGSRLYPMVPNAKEKMTMWITSLFIFHWLSSNSLAGLLDWSFLTNWIFSIRPQINIKPQLKLVQRTSSCHSSHSNLSFSMEEPSTDLDIGLEPEDGSTQGLLKNIQGAKRSISVASDVFQSMASGSRDSLMSLESDEDEVDVDPEIDYLSQKLNQKQEIRINDEDQGPFVNQMTGGSVRQRMISKNALQKRELSN